MVKFGTKVPAVLLAAFSVFGFGLFTATASAQATSAVQPRIVRPVDDTSRVTLPGSVHPLAQARFDQGAVTDSFAAERMLLLLKRSTEQENNLKQFVESVHNSSSPRFHQWLTPAQFGAAYGPADSDIVAVTSWLQLHGFSVSNVNQGRTAIEFSGTAGQIRNAFQTEIRTYRVNGQLHHANSKELMVPAALSPVIAGIASLNDFHAVPQIRDIGPAKYNPHTKEVVPEWTYPVGQGFYFVVSPADFAIEYNLAPVYSKFKGDGQTIGIIGASNIDLALVKAYRGLFGFSATNLPTVVVDGTDPGINSAATETYLDLEIAGSVAPNAKIIYYTSSSSAVSDGLELAALRAVDDDVAGVLSTSYGQCEQFLGAGGNLFWNNIWQQAAAQGQTSFVSSGDGGSAGCDDFNVYPTAAIQGKAVSGLTSTPYNVSVGGTDFYYSQYAGGSTAIAQELFSYWKSTSSQTPSASLARPIPEQPWNDSMGLNVTNGGYFSSGSSSILAGSGGASSAGLYDASGNLLGGYLKPAWQNGAGVPADKVRDIPDVSLFASGGTNYSFYPICAKTGDCTTNNSASDGGAVLISGAGGTSASSPAFAGIQALVNQATSSRHGQIGYVLYPLAQQFPAVFHDITIGSNNVGCRPGTADCVYSTRPGDPSNNNYTLDAYFATPGYDQAVGLGTVDVDALINNWAKITFKSSTTTLTATPVSSIHGTSVRLTSVVTGTGGTPSGTIALVMDPTPGPTHGSIGPYVSTLDASGSATTDLTSLPGGSYDLYANYSGDGIFSASKSSPQHLTISAEASAINLTGNYYSCVFSVGCGLNSFTSGAAIPYGSFIATFIKPSGLIAKSGRAEGVATGSASFTDGTMSATVNLDSGGKAEWDSNPVGAPTGFATGAHSVAVRYSGDKSYNASASTIPLNFTVVKAIPAVAITVFPQYALPESPSNFEAVVDTRSYFAGPTGTVAFYLGATLLPGTTITPGFDANGFPQITAKLSTTLSVPGTYTVKAVYSGDANFGTVTSAPIATQVSRFQVKMTTSFQPGTITVDQPTLLSVTVAGQPGRPIPTGTVLLNNGPFVVPAKPLDATGKVTFAIPANSLPVGSNTIYAFYSGDSYYIDDNPSTNIWVTGSSGTQKAVVIFAGPTSSVDPHDTFTVTGTVKAASGAAIPTGTLYLYGSGNFQRPTQIDGNGNATFTVNAQYLQLGTNSLVLNYSGDTNFAALVSEPANVNVVGTLKMSVNPLKFTTQSANGTALVTLTDSTGYLGAVKLSAALISYPAGATKMPLITLKSDSIDMDSSGNASEAISVNFLTNTAVNSTGTFRHRLGYTLGGGAFLGLTLLFGIPARKRSWRAMLGLLVLFTTLGGIGCGGGGGGGTTVPPPPTSSIVKGLYVIRITGTHPDNITGSTDLQVTIQ